MEETNKLGALTQLFVLRYPNGREHERTLRVQRHAGPGDEITLVGRVWRVSHLLPPDRRNPVRRVVCTPVDALSPLDARTRSTV